MSPELFDVLGAQHQDHRVFGVVTGIVADNNDPLDLGRVMVKFPWLDDDAVSTWARTITPMAGDTRGFYAIPEVGDEVLVAFEHGRVDFPYVLGSLWNTNQMPPESNASDTNDHRSLTSRSGHVIRLDDTNGDERIEIIDSSTNNSIVISTSDNSIQIVADGDIAITSNGGKLTLDATDVEITGQNSVTVKGDSSVEVSSQGTTTIKGTTVEIN
ncbi:MAG: phage baseplate assembly protein V [Solirubrobacteraceae bacterium]